MMVRRLFARVAILALLTPLAGCATVVRGHERALRYTAHGGMSQQTLSSGWYWHLPWNRIVKYDLRWQSHTERIHIHSKDGLHMDIAVVVVVRPDPKDLYALDTEAGPFFYEQIVRPALFGATRDASGGFGHLEIATETHAVEESIRKALVQHLGGSHIELQEVSIANFDLPPEVESAANKKAVDAQLLAAKQIEIELAAKDAEVAQTKKRGALEEVGLEKKLKAEQDLADAEAQARIERARSEVEKTRAESDAAAARIRADGERQRIAAIAAAITPNYVRLQALDALARATASSSAKTIIVPTTKDGLPAIYAPFLNPYAGSLSDLGATPAKGTP